MALKQVPPIMQLVTPDMIGRIASALTPRQRGDASAFKDWLRQISQRVAEASREGGFLGIGGGPVSEAEKATLTEIASAPRLAA